MSYTRLQNLGANGYPFTPAQIPTGILFGLYNGNEFDHGDNKIYALMPGSTVVQHAITTASYSVPYIIEQDCLMRSLFFNANSNITSGSVKAQIYHVSPNTSNVASIELNTLTGSNVSDTTFSYKFHKGDAMYVTLSMAFGGNGNDKQPNLHSFQLNIGLF
jgi:hypothetical protein